ncbi:hypothetical protein L3Q82_001178 [Scortum barcoo]|uniref:Uncharacterized protein n=1 Tax=Scortum barcoo TaxID=214431 RepID=A0ACB8W776_9TELE|nr:hypothetical protein L3Q82_001178 [Scortum barcoo]
MEVLRVDMLMEMGKTDKDSINFSVIDTKMSKTFAARRLEIVNSRPSVLHVKERWPALFLESQVFAEYQRINNQRLSVELYAALDKHTERLLALATEMQGKSGRKCPEDLLHLKGILSVLLQEDDAELFCTCKESADQGPAFGRSAAIVSIIADSEDESIVPFHPLEVKADYPKGMSHTFEFIQKVLLNVDGERLKSKILSLKNNLRRRRHHKQKRGKRGLCLLGYKLTQPMQIGSSQSLPHKRQVVLVNKMEEMKLRIVSAKIDSCVAIVTETWLDNNIPDAAVELLPRRSPVAVCPALPIRGVVFLMGNHIAGGKVTPILEAQKQDEIDLADSILMPVFSGDPDPESALPPVSYEDAKKEKPEVTRTGKSEPRLRLPLRGVRFAVGVKRLGVWLMEQGQRAKLHLECCRQDCRGGDEARRKTRSELQEVKTAITNNTAATDPIAASSQRELEVGAGLPGEAELGPGAEAAAGGAAEDNSEVSWRRQVWGHFPVLPGPLQPMAPLLQGQLDGQEFSVTNVIISFSWQESPGEESAGMQLLVLRRPL